MCDNKEMWLPLTPLETVRYVMSYLKNPDHQKKHAWSVLDSPEFYSARFFTLMFSDLPMAFPDGCPDEKRMGLILAIMRAEYDATAFKLNQSAMGIFVMGPQ